ncbi:hypothetical protein J5N97_007885 [Dioscorea zingiberensis]|uniref:Uncharacterized protein n=1 Tax=Dioscorea zingiberensis TaxID=325984 RepID=A0A9D5DE50_9LILI|nr:hypothetical protein J5N97_007885 [Dioscorea zingiberensis]
MVGRLTLINSTTISLPVYGLNTYAILDATFDGISRLVRRFLWGRDSNSGGAHLIGWSTVIKPKANGGLGIKDLKRMEDSLMVKHALDLINQEDKNWIKYMTFKYGNLNIWNLKMHVKPSYIFKSLHIVITKMKIHTVSSIVIKPGPPIDLGGSGSRVIRVNAGLIT